jgi:nitrate reductase alpha subunit
VASLKTLNGTAASGPAAGWPKIETDIDACEAILSLAPETNGEVTLKA